MLRYLLFASLALGMPSAAQPRHVVLADPGLSSEAGAQTLLSARLALEQAQDYALPYRFGDERSVGGKALGVAYRLATFTFVEYPLNRLTLVVQHEVFGHGAFARERRWDERAYSIDLPLPYGPGGGYASFEPPPTVTADAIAAVAAAGGDANTALADAVVEDVMQSGRIGRTAAALYVTNALTPASYILVGLDDELQGLEGNDAVALLAALNARADTLGLERIGRDDLQRATVAPLLDPLLYVGLYGIVKQYLYSGREAMDLPTLGIGSVRYLPSVRYTYGPHGGEVMLDHYLARGDQAARVRMRTSAGAVETTWGLGVRAASVARVGGVTFDASADVWSQPSLQLDTQESVRGGGLGGAVRVGAHVPVGLGGRGAVFAELGAKTFGFVTGDPLRGGALARAGLSLRARP